MKNFTVNVIPDKEDGKVPVYLAGQVMVDIQQLLMDVGEYLTAKELRIQRSMTSLRNESTCCRQFLPFFLYAS